MSRAVVAYKIGRWLGEDPLTGYPITRIEEASGVVIDSAAHGAVAVMTSMGRMTFEDKQYRVIDHSGSVALAVVPKKKTVRFKPDFVHVRRWGFGGYMIDRTEWQYEKVIEYEPPENTLSLRYALCHDHHVACDCREAEFNEQIHELKGEEEWSKKKLAEILKGHATWLWTRDGELDPRACMCTGCIFARSVHWSEINEKRAHEDDVPKEEAAVLGW